MLEKIRIAEMFAGVGGFRLGLEGYSDPEHPEFDMPAAGPFATVWANQWEPPGTAARQFAWRCYESRFGEGSCVNEDIAKVLDQAMAGEREIPDFDMLVGGFPCQDYSVARPLALAAGIEGKKGVLWWEIRRMLELKRPRYALFENVDRLLKSPATQRGRDFAIILSCLNALGYSAEWRVINAADYGMPQKRRRVYIFCTSDDAVDDLKARVMEDGIMARAFPIFQSVAVERELEVGCDPVVESEGFGKGLKVSPFENAGVMSGGRIYTAKVTPAYDGPATVLGDILVPDSEVPESFFLNEASVSRWEYLKGSKSEPRLSKGGFEYNYTEGAMSFPDNLDVPARTILTSEGGSSPNRSKHVVMGDSGRLRRLVPDELDQVQMFPKGWTKGIGDGHRAFCMGNALVTGIPHRIGQALAARI